MSKKVHIGSWIGDSEAYVHYKVRKSYSIHFIKKYLKTYPYKEIFL